MRRLRRLTWAIVAGVAVMLAATGFRVFTFPWEADRVRRATALALHEPEETLTGSELQSFLRGFEVDNTRQFDFQCALHRRAGCVTIGGQDYAVELIDDKFAGEVLIVHGRWKTVELVRPRR